MATVTESQRRYYQEGITDWGSLNKKDFPEAILQANPSLLRRIAGLILSRAKTLEILEDQSDPKVKKILEDLRQSLRHQNKTILPLREPEKTPEARHPHKASTKKH